MMDFVLNIQMGSKKINSKMLFSAHKGCRVSLCTPVKSNYRTASDQLCIHMTNVLSRVTLSPDTRQSRSHC